MPQFHPIREKSKSREPTYVDLIPSLDSVLLEQILNVNRRYQTFLNAFSISGVFSGTGVHLKFNHLPGRKK